MEIGLIGINLKQKVRLKGTAKMYHLTNGVHYPTPSIWFTNALGLFQEGHDQDSAAVVYKVCISDSGRGSTGRDPFSLSCTQELANCEQ
jgi:hypothetical protein